MERIIIREPRQIESEKDNKFEDILKQSIIKSLSSRYKVEFTDREVSSFSKETDLHLYINLLYVREKISRPISMRKFIIHKPVKLLMQFPFLLNTNF
ncbi:MAG: hypothetical protein IPO06_28655 [Leptospiraceae bacterium]|nr:hypothetical protein [Leptospiraceae bacterium]